METRTVLSLLKAMIGEEWVGQDYGMKQALRYVIEDVERAAMEDSPEVLEEEKRLPKTEAILSYRRRTGVDLRTAYNKITRLRG